MGKRSSIQALDPRVQEAVNAAVRAGKTIDEIVTLIVGEGAEASRSAVGRYVKSAREQMRDYTYAQDMAKLWVERMGSEPEGDVARLMPHMLRTLAFQTMSQMQPDEEKGKTAKPMDLMLLGKAIEHINKAEKTNIEKESKLMELVKARAQKASENVSKLARKGGLSDEAIRQIEEQVLGISR